MPAHTVRTRPSPAFWEGPGYEAKVASAPCHIKLVCFSYASTLPMTLLFAFSLIAQNCDYYEFECDNGYECVDEDYECDGYEDCYDGSDEEDCSDSGKHICVCNVRHVFMLWHWPSCLASNFSVSMCIYSIVGWPFCGYCIYMHVCIHLIM